MVYHRPMNESKPFNQLQLQFRDPIQRDYEAIRPIILFGEPIAERSRETEMPSSTLSDKAKRFVLKGMIGLVDQRSEPKALDDEESHPYPKPVAEYILYLKQLYPPIGYREIVRIVWRKYGYKTNHHTVKRFLDRHPMPLQLELTLPSFHEQEDAYEARYQVVCLYQEGWKKKSIAGLLKLSHTHVSRLVKAFEERGFEALDDKRTRPATHPDNQMTFPFLDSVFKIQQDNPRIGSFRIHGILQEKEGDDIPSERTVSRAMAYNRVLRNAPPPYEPAKKTEDEVKTFPYRPYYRHQYWFIDIRYLVKIDGKWVYSICIIDGYSRKILAGLTTRFQDELAVLQLLHAALAEYHRPHGVVSDNGSVFTAHAFENVLKQLEIESHHTEPGKPWQNLIESQFRVQSRMADHQFEQAKTVDEVDVIHAAFITRFNITNHWAHRDRYDGCTTPVTVLGWEKGRELSPKQLRSAFRSLQLLRTVNRHGLVSIHRFYLYAERGLSRKRVSIWIYDDRLNIEYQHALLARYTCQLDRKTKKVVQPSNPTTFSTIYADPQLAMFELTDDQWLKILERPYKRKITPLQANWSQLAWLLWLFGLFTPDF